jgi:hypothetical protein
MAMPLKSGGIGVLGHIFSEAYNIGSAKNSHIFHSPLNISYHKRAIFAIYNAKYAMVNIL